MFEPQKLVTFLSELKDNNNKVWFDENRDRYQKIRGNLLDFATKIHAGMISLDPQIIAMPVKKAPHHINRDVRFSHNKKPYKEHWGMKFSNNGRKKGIAGYGVVWDTAGNMHVGGGMADFSTAQLNLIRDDIVENPRNFRKVITDKQFQSTFHLWTDGALKRRPAGYDEDSPFIEFLRLKRWQAHTQAIPMNIWSEWPETELAQHVLEKFELLVPFVTTINSLVLPQGTIIR